MKNMRIALILFFLPIFSFLHAQQDSIRIQANLDREIHTLSVVQSIIYHNKLGKSISKIKLLNWIAAYKRKKSPLAYRKIEDRKSDLFFAKNPDLGALESVQISVKGENISVHDLSSENLFLTLPKSLPAGKSVKINLNYTLKLPADLFTGYGFSPEKLTLKYFFIVPDSFEDQNQYYRYYQDIEETQNAGSFWDVSFKNNTAQTWTSNLPQTEQNHFSGKLIEDPEFILSEPNLIKQFNVLIDGENISVKLAYKITSEDRKNLEFYLPLQLKFIKDKIGFLPKILLIDEKFHNKENFMGDDDIKFWKFKYQLFTDAQKIDLDYFGILAKKIMQKSFITDKITEHWFKNGLKTYLEIEYLNQFYKDTKLLGQLPENVKIFGIKPLKWFYASELKLTERYGLAYNYIASKNLDQKINSPYTVLSNFNQMAISNFEMGSLLYFLSKQMGEEKFNDFLQKYFATHLQQRVDPKYFLTNLKSETEGNSAFLADFIQHKNRDNFKLKNYKKSNTDFDIKIKKNTNLPLPFKLETETETGEKVQYFYTTEQNQKTAFYKIPQKDAEKIIINDHYIFPEKSYRDNYIYTKGLFSNMKKIKFKLFRDIPNPEYNEIYVNPKLNFNAYDKVLLGLNFRNKSLFDQPFLYSFTPYYSSGTNEITGSGALSYSFLPPESFYQSLTFGVSGSYFHYDYDLIYRKLTASALLDFTKNPRSTVGKSIGLSYSYFNRDLDPKKDNTNDYDVYDLWSLSYNYSDNKLINEKYFSANFQTMKDFQKFSVEGFYRWEYAQNKKISFRLFAGYFLANKTKNDLFDYGISKVSNYSFSYGLLGQSAMSGLLSQQYILADGGFKSYFKNTVNQWITSANMDSHIWKIFNVYADAGLYKNKFQHPKFIWDTGVKLNLIPDFLEIYFPVQSSLGFEPSFKDYGKRIRFTLILNFNAITNYFRRGWY